MKKPLTSKLFAATTIAATLIATQASAAREVSIASISNGNATLAFGAADGAAYTLAIGYGTSDGGADTNAWDTFATLGNVSANATSQTVALPAGWGDTVTHLRFFLLDTPLPAGATRLEYIESSGTQWIDSGVNGATGLKFSCDLSWDTSHTGSSANSDWMLVGARKDTSSDTRIVPIYIEQTVCFGYGKFARTAFSYTLGVRHEIVADFTDPSASTFLYRDGKPLNIYKDDRTPSTGSTIDTGRNLYIFAANWGGSANLFAKAKLYRLVIQRKNASNGVLEPVRHFVPCRDGNGVACLYDIVSGGYFRNSGSGTFADGAVVSATVASSSDTLTTTIGDNGAADTVLWDDAELPSGMSLVKTGSNRAIVQTAAAIDGDIDVRGGSLVFSGRTCTNEWYRFTFNGNKYMQEVQVALGDLRVYSGTTMNAAEEVAYGIGTNGNVRAVGTSPADLAREQCAASFATTTTKPDGQTQMNLWDLRNAFDNSAYNAVLSASKYYIYGNASQVWVAFRMAAGKNRVQSYLPVKSYVTWHWHPSAWLFETSPDGSNWTTVDTQTDALTSEGYGSTPFVIKGFLADGAAGFDSSANVKVAIGATLDSTGVAGGQTLSHLTVDWAAGAGTIKGVTIAQNGILDLVDVPAGTDLGGAIVPVTISGVANGANFSSWTVRVDGVATEDTVSWNGSALRFPTTSIGNNGADDTVVWEDPFLLEGMPLVKVGSNRAIVQTASAIDADIDIHDGTMVFSGRTCTNEFYRFVFNGSQYGSSIPIAIGDLRVYADAAGTEEIAEGIGANDNVLAVGTTAPNLGKGQCVASFATTTTKPDGQTAMNLWDLRNAFDNSAYNAVLSASSYYIYNGSSTQWVAFRMAEGNNRVQSYLPVKSYITWYWHPNSWLFQTSVDGGYWTTVDTQTGALTGDGYGSTPFVIKGFLADNAAGFDSSANVKVASGATLDATGVSGGQTLSHLTVDWAAGAGTIRGVTIAQNGVLDLVNVPANARLGGATIPVTLADAVGLANFGTWAVRVNGAATTERLRWNGSVLRVIGALTLSFW